MKKLIDLPNDIYDLFDPDSDHKVSEENLEIFAQECKALLRRRLAKAEPNDRPIRFSSLGRPDRQIWYAAHPDPAATEKLTPKTYIKFAYGDLLEQFFLFLAREAGHSVTDTQKEVEVDGVTGSIDAVVDNVVIDVKSASPAGYKKFKQQQLTEEDPFGYVAQLSGYSNVLNPGKDAAWLAFDKVSGDICVSPLPAKVIEEHKPEPRIEHLKKVIEQDEPPARCYEDIPDGKSGNRKLGTGCSYCADKFRCWPNLRTFLYSTGPRHLTHVAREPDVFEVGGKEFP